MATIASIVKQGKGTAGSNGSWRIVEDGDALELWHYAHRMLRWNPEEPSDPEVLDYSIGWGSVSDQGGMNQAFRVLGLWLRYERAGGASTVDTRPRVAEARGYEAGKAAGSWVIDGNTSEETARSLLDGLEDGDPAVYDSLPSAPLSGEWADGIQARGVLLELDAAEDDEAADELLTAFEPGAPISATATRGGAMEAKCSQCGKAMNPVERMLGPVCGKSCRDNHQAVAGGH